MNQVINAVSAWKAVWLLALCLPTLGGADDSQSTLVVTGTRSEKPLIEAPVRTELVSKEMLERYHAQDLAQALRVIPGLQIRKIHGKAGEELQIQGLDGDRVLILIDGEPVSASTGSTVDLTQVGTVNVARIEVIKGAVSALYGSAAMGGVVNVITAHPDEDNATVGLRLGHFDSGNQDTPNERQVTLEGQQNWSGWRTQLHTDFRQSGGLDYDTSNIDFNDYEGDRIHLGLKTRKQFGNGQEVQLGIKRFIEDLSRPYADFAPGQGVIPKTRQQDTERDTLSAKWIVNPNHRLQLHYESLDDDTQQDVDATSFIDQERKATHQKGKLAWHASRGLNREHELSYGLELMQADLEQTQTLTTATESRVIEELSPDADRNSQEFYVQDDYFASDTWEWVLGLRGQEDSDFGSHFAPRLNALYTPDSDGDVAYQLRFGLGQGYRVPNLKERFYVFDHSINGYMVLGNPDLTPESSISVQLGGSLIADDVWQLDANLFLNDLEDMISTTRSGTQGNIAIYRYQNIEEARTSGLELSGRWRFSETLSSTFAYNYLQAENRNTGKQLIDRPEHSLNLTLDWYWRDDTSLSLLAKQERGGYADEDNNTELPTWEAIDLKLNHQFSKRLRGYLGIDNLSDVRRPLDVTGRDPRPTTGRYFYTGLKYQW